MQYGPALLNFNSGLLKKFIFLTPENTFPFYFLHSVEDFNIALPVINPFDIIKDYNVSVNDSVLDEIGLKDMEDLLLLNVVVIPQKIEKMTANLAAPVIINIKSLKGKQVILDNSPYSIRHPLYKDFITLRNGGGDNAGTVKEEK